MPTRCCVISCTTYSSAKKRASLFRFPAVKVHAGKMKQELQKKRREAWIKAVNRKNLNIEKLHAFRICEKHFALGRPAKLSEVNHPDWIPSLSMGYGRNKDKEIRAKVERYVRQQNRENMPVPVKVDTGLRHIEVIDLDSDPKLKSTSPTQDTHPNGINRGIELESGVSIQTLKFPDTIESLMIENQRLLVEAQKLREMNVNLQLQLDQWSYTEESFKTNDDKVQFYTGLPNVQMVNLILEYIDDFLSAIEVNNLNNFQKLILTLMKLRLNASFQDLSFRFNIDETQANQIFKETIVFLQSNINGLIHWPDRGTTQVNLPESFKEKFGDRARVITDCFEVTIEEPPMKKSKPLPKSDDKNDFTLKYLIGVTPHRIISFISDGWSSGISDSYITMHCGILNKLSPGDVILADRGVLVHEAAIKKKAKCLTSSSMRETYHNSESEKTAQVESARVIHIDKLVVETIRKKFRILNDPVPIWLVKTKHQNRSLLDCVVHVCCILYNLLESVVTIEY